MGGGLELDNGSYAYLNSIDTANQTVTFKSTLDADNALTNANVKAVVIPTDFYISGAANTTTYSYIDPVGIASSIESLLSYNMYMKFQGYPLVKVTAIDTNNETITFSETLDASSAISNLNYEYGRYDINQATGLNSHVEGADNESSGSAAHAEGRTTIASGDYGSHAEGHGTTASGNRSHAEGNHTTAQNDSEHAEGSFNVSHTGNALNEKTQHSIGIGEYVSASSTIYKNAFEVMQNGDIYVYGLGDYQGTDTHVQNASILSLQSYISSLEQRIYALEHPNT